MRILIPLAAIPLFILWILYRFLIKKDLYKYKSELLTGTVFSTAWGIIYCLMIYA